MLSQFFKNKAQQMTASKAQGPQKENVFSKVMKKKKSATGHSNPNRLFAAFGKR